MEEYLNKGIKEIITQYPKVADILNEYNIGCIPCNVGTCFLKDIVQIHNLSTEEEQQLIARIAKVVYPDREVNIPKIERKVRASSGEIKYSPPMKRLVEEHKLIKKWLTLIPKLLENLDMKSGEDRQLIHDGVDFIRNYADKFHHAKEEEILFKYFDENLDILKAMLIDHENARAHTKAALEGLREKNKAKVVQHLGVYTELLTEHIKKEDEILYVWMDRNLTVTQVGELFTKFDQAESKLDKEVMERCKKFAQEAEERIQRLEAKKEVAK